MAKIALLASGDGWNVRDILCTSGPTDRPFEERHSGVSIALVAAGTFQYRTAATPELMVPGSFLLGAPHQSFECAHEHGTGDRCISFHYEPDFFERVTGSAPRFRTSRLPPLRASAPLVAKTIAARDGANRASWEELAIELAVHAVSLANDVDCDTQPMPPNAVARVTRAVRLIERRADAELPLQRLASDACLSPYHFLRTFTRLTGVTPHQFALRTRLRQAALRLQTSDARVIDIALDSGFGDVSNFNRAFRTEFGTNPRAYRACSAPVRML